MDELRLNKLFAAFLFAALLLMAGIKISDIMVPHQKLAQNSYVIEVEKKNAQDFCKNFTEWDKVKLMI